jgi:endonuclease YncB( thermonuclease family)
MAGCGADTDRTSGFSYTNRAPTEYWERGDSNAKQVVKVESGDTVVVDIDGDETTVKLIGISAPHQDSSDDREECLGKKSTEYLRSLLTDKSVLVFYQKGQPRTDGDGNTRASLKEIGPNGRYVATEQVRAGWASRITEPLNSIDVNHDEMSMQSDAEKGARQQQVGMWNPDLCR